MTLIQHAAGVTAMPTVCTIPTDWCSDVCVSLDTPEMGSTVRRSIFHQCVTTAIPTQNVSLTSRLNSTDVSVPLVTKATVPGVSPTTADRLSCAILMHDVVRIVGVTMSVGVTQALEVTVDDVNQRDVTLLTTVT